MKLKPIPLLLLFVGLIPLLVNCADNELTVSEPPEGFVTHQDRSHGFSISYPKTWINRTAEEVRSIQAATVSAAQSSPHPSIKDLAPDLTNLWFVADGGIRGIDWQEVRIFEDTHWAEAEQTYDRKYAEADLRAAFKDFNLKLIAQEFGMINGFDAGIQDYTHDALYGTGTSRLVALNTEYVTVLCGAFVMTDVGKLEGAAVPRQEMADTCWNILRTFRLER